MERPDKSRKLLFLKTDLPALFAFILFAGLIFFYLIPGFEKTMMDRKRTLIKEMTSSAYSILDYYQSMVEKGTLTAEESKQLAKEAIGSIRYGDQLKDYFWITDRKPFMIMHPYRPDLNGNDLSEYRDSKGKLIFVEFAKSVSQTGESYVEYMWQWNDDSTKIVPKLSYVRLFEPWDWIIGTGIYIADVRTEIRNMEFKSLIISGIIGLIIILLLSVITRQSHQIEQKRMQVEEDLLHSREMYRTLAEVVTEGVIIWTNDGIQANKTLLSMLGYPEEEFKEKKISDIISSCDINLLSGAERIYDSLEARQFGECVLKSSDGSQISVYSDYSRILIGNTRAIVIVVKPVKQIYSGLGLTLPYELLSSVSTGFFRISFGRKIRFLDATNATLNMLGFDRLDELLKEPVESIFQDASQLKILKKTLTVKTAVKDFELSIVSKSGLKFESLINIFLTEHRFPETWCVGSIDYLTSSEPTGIITGILPPGYYFSLIRSAPVTNIMAQVAVCSYETPISSALEIMIGKDSQHIIIYNVKNKPVGIADMQSIAVGFSGGLTASAQAGNFISNEPDFIGSEQTLAFAAERMAASGNKPLLVKDQKENVTGIITEREISYTAGLSEDYLKYMIEKASTADDLKVITASIKQMAATMIMGNCETETVSFFISHMADQICRKAIDFCIESADEPPCQFAFIQTGSAGRMEQTLSTDQDNGIIFENCTGELLEKASVYFRHLGNKINEVLAIAGFNLCKGNNMAGNQKWCQPLRVWEEYFSDWISVPDPANLLDMSIFFDLRHCYGDQELTDNLRSFVKNNLAADDIYFRHLSAEWSHFQPPAIKEETGIIDIKKILMPLTGIVRLYSLKNGVSEYSTNSRICALYKGKHFTTRMLRDSLSAKRELLLVRFRHQAECINKGLEPDNLVDLSLATENTLQILNRSANIVRDLILKSETDFHITEI